MERAALRLRAAVRQGRPGPYQVQAGIAALHAFAVSYEKTNWADVRSLYDRLYALDPSPVVLLEPRGRHALRASARPRRWTRSTPCATGSTATTCGTRPAPTCSPPSTARPRRSAAARTRRWSWRPTRPSGN